MQLGSVWPWLRQMTYPWAKHVIMQTCEGLGWLKATMPRAEGLVIPNPCVFPLPENEPRIAPPVNSLSQKLLIAAGSLTALKQFELAIQAFSELSGKFPEWKLAIVGEGPERTYLESLVSATGLEGRVIMPGRVGNVSEWYRSSDIFVMSSEFEGFPNVLLEALAHGLPAVSLNCATGPADIIEDGVNGYLVPPDAGADGLKQHLEMLMADDAKRVALSERALEVRTEFAFDTIGPRWDRALGLSHAS